MSITSMGSTTNSGLPQPLLRRQRRRLTDLFCFLIICILCAVSFVAPLALLPDDSRFVSRLSPIEQVQELDLPNLETSGNGNVVVETTYTLRNKRKKLPLVECALSTPRPSVNASTSGHIRITVRSDLSPIASRVFLDLVESHYYDGTLIFRVLRNFIAQWGVRSGNDPWPNPKPPKTADQITNGTLSNRRGTLSFAGGNPATRQVFINFDDANVRLDKENSRPFASVDEESMIILDGLYTGYKDGQGQIPTLKKGEDATLNRFPNMSRIDRCRIVGP